MQKKIKLNRENIQSDKLRKFVREEGLGEKLLDDETLLKSRRSLIPDNTKKDVWLFGYGSLIWNPVIEPVKKLKVKNFLKNESTDLFFLTPKTISKPS